MENLIQYINNTKIRNISSNNWYTSLSANINNEISENYFELIKNDGKYLDSVLHKIDVYTHRISSSNYINESDQNVLFDVDEQFTARNILIAICNEYLNSICLEYALENNIVINESAKDLINTIAKKAKDAKDKISQGLKEVSDKIKIVKDFIQKIINNTIKSAKELVDKIGEMMTSFGSSVQKLINQLGGDEKESYDFLHEKIKGALKDEKVSKENIYETLSLELNTSLGYIRENEYGTFVRENEYETFVRENEYDDASSAKTSKKSKIKGKLSMLGKAGLKILLQMIAYYAVTVVLPAVITLIGGPLAGAVAEVLCKVIWSSAVIYKQVQDMRKTYKSEEYKNSPKWMKVLRWAMFFMSIGFAAFAGGKAIKDGYEIGLKIFKGAADQVLPSDMVQKVTEILNNWYKAMSGKNAGGYEALVKAQNQTFEKITEVTSKSKEASDQGKENFDKNSNHGEFKSGETNNVEKMKSLAGDEYAQEIKNKIIDTKCKSSGQMINAIKDVNVETPGVTTFAVDGATLGKIGRKEYIELIAKQLKLNPSDIDISQISNTALMNATKHQAGTVFQVIVKGDATKEFTDKAMNAVATIAKNHHMGKGFCHVMSKVIDPSQLNPIKLVSKIPVETFKNSFSAFAGLFPIASKKMKSGGFKMRLGSGRTKTNKIYEIPADGIKEMSFSEASSKYGSTNSKGFTNMSKISKENYEAIVKYKDELEAQKDLSRSDKKKIKKLTKQIEKMKEGSAEYKVLVFYTKADSGDDKKVEEAKKEKEINDKGLTPVFLYNPIMMAGIDLAPRSKSKGPRTNPYYAKGLFSHLEFLPTDKGMNLEDIINMFTDLIEESLKACYDMNPDVPCIKDGKTYIENEESVWKDKPRLDFGDFTNKELTDIFNNPKTLSNYLGGEYNTKQRTVEKTDSEKNKEKHDKAIEEYEKIIKNNQEVKDIIDKNKSLKTALLDDEGNVKKDAVEAISGNLFRIEKNYLGKNKKKGLFSRIKDFLFGKKKKDENNPVDEIDPEALKELALKCASIRKDKRKAKVEEGLEDYADLMIFEANIEILKRDWDIYWYDRIDESEEILEI
ncbi:MAG: hypothetical protein J1F35_06530 [Erysipelotrichales bacterium]|nr:hypothetical protein [Erysipelotrichales bacterium]